jgi:hypothetical protein
LVPFCYYDDDDDSLAYNSELTKRQNIRYYASDMRRKEKMKKLSNKKFYDLTFLLWDYEKEKAREISICAVSKDIMSPLLFIVSFS